jgi:hypothetical protein
MTRKIPEANVIGRNPLGNTLTYELLIAYNEDKGLRYSRFQVAVNL